MGANMKIFKSNILLAVTILLICGCLGKSQNILNDTGSDKLRPSVILLLPVESKTENNNAARLFRSRVMEELYFKGYSKFDPEEIDRKLDGSAYQEIKTSAMVRQKVKEASGADAIMHCRLEDKSGAKIFYAPINIAIQCEIISADHGETIWQEKTESIIRNFYFTDKDLDKKSHDNFENVIEEVVDTLVKTLPDGPNLRSE